MESFNVKFVDFDLEYLVVAEIGDVKSAIREAKRILGITQKTLDIKAVGMTVFVTLW